MTHRQAMKVFDNMYDLNYRVGTISKAAKRIAVTGSTFTNTHEIIHTRTENRIRRHSRLINIIKGDRVVMCEFESLT